MEEKIEVTESSGGPKKGMGLKLFLIGIPIFIVQLIVVYFITANIILKQRESDEEVGSTDEDPYELVEEADSEESEGESGAHFYEINDVVVNPAGTSGQRLLQVSIGFDLPSESQLQRMESKEILLKDIIITTLSSKSLYDLGQPNYKDSLKVQLSEKIAEQMPDLRFNDIYIFKYIIN
jgi:flagellar FliL protein